MLEKKCFLRPTLINYPTKYKCFAAESINEPKFSIFISNLKHLQLIRIIDSMTIKSTVLNESLNCN